MSKTPQLAEQKCPCGDRPADQCPGEWEPGCDLGANEKHAKVAEQAQPVAWTPASELPPPRRPLDFESVVVLAVAETDDGAYQITPAKVTSLRKGEWREVRFDHDGQGRKIVVRCWMPMPKFPKTVPAAPEAPAPPAPQPLTDEDIHLITGHCGVSTHAAINIARAVEAAVIARMVAR